MKDPRFILGIVVVIALGAFGFEEWRKVGELNREIAGLKAAAAAQAESEKEELAKLQRMVDDRKQVIAQLEEQRKEVARNEPAAKDAAGIKPDEAGNAAPANKDFGSMMKKMFTDPNMKKMIRSTQMMSVKMMYGDLGKELGLGADRANQVMDLLGERQMAIATKGMKIFAGDSAEGASVEEVGKEVEATTEDCNAQLENLLGKDGMAKLTEYETALADRMQIQQYKQAFAANGVPLDDKESAGLLGIMKEERTKVPASPLDPGAKDFGAAMQAMQSEETFTKLIAQQEEVDRRVLSRARNVLAPDKMVQFEGVQKQQRDLQKMGMEMSRQFLNPK